MFFFHQILTVVLWQILDKIFEQCIRRVPLVEQELLTLPEHLRSPQVFSGVPVTRSLVLYVCFVGRCLSFCTFFFWPEYCLFFFDIRILITPLVSSYRYLDQRILSMDSRENNCLCLNLAIHYYSLPSSFPQTLKKFERMTAF